MSNKTCVGCRYMLHKDTFEVCTHSMTEISMFDEACEHFAPPTNGDVIRQGGDFAEYFVYETGAMFASTLIVDKTFDTYEEAVEATEDYLNAPAESQLNDAIQNVIKDGAKNAIDIHEAAYAPDMNVATKESEGKDE